MAENERWKTYRRHITPNSNNHNLRFFRELMDPLDSTTQIKDVTPDNVRRFLLAKYSGPIKGKGSDPVEVPDTFDFLSGIIDSFGILEMVSSIEEEFRIRLDLAALDAEHVTILGPLSEYVARNAKA